jgi:crotonobetainyl-CoA:carnitine CoA-transferase CaiB-like acyl-CoA transferase
MVFDGLRVLDLASFAAGPAAAMILADFGAGVIKIEPPGGEKEKQVVQTIL